MKIELTQLHRFIIEHYDLEELRTLCFTLGVPYGDLGGEGRSSRARELILWMDRRGNLDALLVALQQDRPDLFEKSGLSTGSNTGLPAREAHGLDSASVAGSGAVAQDDSVAAGEGGVAVGRDIHGTVIIAGAGAQINITTQDDGMQDEESGEETDDSG